MISVHALLTRLLRAHGWLWLVVAAVVFAAVTRVYMLSESALFLGDQGRDALIVSRIFTERDLVFIGPVTSVGNMYLGPFYYYFMLPFLLLSYPSPVGPAYGVALVGIAFVFFLYYWGRELVGQKAAAFGSVLAACSVVVIDYARFSWNPNIAPIFALYLVFAVARALKGQYWYWVGAAVAASILIQLHYVTLLACAAAGLVLLYQVVCAVRAQKWRGLVLPILVSVGVVLASITPLVLFDFKHDGLNRNALLSLVSSENNFSAADTELVQNELYRERTLELAQQVTLDMYTGVADQANLLLLALGVVLLLYHIVYRKKATYYSQVLLLSLFVVVSVFGLSFYQNAVYDHYVLFTVPYVVLLWGYVLAQLWKKPGAKGVVAVLLLGIVLVNAKSYRFTQAGTRYAILQETADAIHARVSPSEVYAIVLLAPSNDLYGMNFRYFLSTNRDKVAASPEFTAVADKLFIIDEEKGVENPQDLPIYEIVTYPSKEVTEMFSIPGGPDVYVLEKPTSSEEE